MNPNSEFKLFITVRLLMDECTEFTKLNYVLTPPFKILIIFD